MARPPWEAEREVDAALALRLVRARFPALAAGSARALGSGWDNSAFLVDDTWVFRFPRREFVLPFLRAECAILPRLARAGLPLAIPEPLCIAETGDGFPWPFAGYRLLPGRTACACGWTVAERMRAAPTLGRFLAALHAIPADEARAWGAAEDPIARLDIATRAVKARATLERLVAAGHLADPEPLARRLAAPSHHPPRSTTLVHGDLYVRHVLIGDDRLPSAVIDWGDVHLGDPAVDLALAHNVLPPAAHAAFRAAYGAIDDETWHLAGLRALVHGLAVADFAIAIADADLQREALQALAWMAEAPP